MFRQVCLSGTSTTPSRSNATAHDIGISPSLTCSIVPTSTLCISGANGTDISSNFASWTSAQGVTGVTFKIIAPGSSYTYSLVGLPGESTSQGYASSLTNANGQGCNFASSGSGTYANHLCFADFAGFNAASYIYPTCDTMSRPIAGTPYTLQFCLSVSSASVAPAAIPTYYSPSGNGSEAFLGNNGFYTGIAGDPALYTDLQGALVTAYFTNIQVLDAAGNPATGWTLVTGDAESTDGNEWNVYTSNLNWSILPQQRILGSVGQCLLRHQRSEQQRRPRIHGDDAGDSGFGRCQHGAPPHQSHDVCDRRLIHPLRGQHQPQQDRHNDAAGTGTLQLVGQADAHGVDARRRASGHLPRSPPVSRRRSPDRPNCLWTRVERPSAVTRSLKFSSPSSSSASQASRSSPVSPPPSRPLPHTGAWPRWMPPSGPPRTKRSPRSSSRTTRSSDPIPARMPPRTRPRIPPSARIGTFPDRSP